MTQTSTYARRRPRINFTMIIFSAVVLLLVGYPLYIYIDSEVSGGVKHTAEGTTVDLKAMSSFAFDQNHGQLQDIPQRWRDLNGKKVILYGELAPSGFGALTDNEFLLCYSVQNCCFSGPPQVQHFVKSQMSGNGQMPLYGGLVKVIGTLHVSVKSEAGAISSVYQLDVDSVKPVS